MKPAVAYARQSLEKMPLQREYNECLDREVD